MPTLTLPESRLQWLLRTIALLDFGALSGVVMPAESMQRIHALLGLGELHVDPVMVYLARTVSLLYVAQGALFWFLSQDVARYRALIAFWGRLFLAGSVIFLAIDRSAELPIWWTTIEFSCLLAIGVSLSWCTRLPRTERPDESPRAEVMSSGSTIAADQASPAVSQSSRG